MVVHPHVWSEGPHPWTGRSGGGGCAPPPRGARVTAERGPFRGTVSGVVESPDARVARPGKTWKRVRGWDETRRCALDREISRKQSNFSPFGSRLCLRVWFCSGFRLGMTHSQVMCNGGIFPHQ